MSDEEPQDPEEEREGVEEVDAVPAEEDEAERGPTIDAPPRPPGSSSDAPGRSNLWPALCHLSTLVTFVNPLLHLGGLVAPLIVWQLKEKDEPEVVYHGKEAINFQLNVLFWTVLLGLPIFTGLECCCCLSVPLVALVTTLDVVFTIIAGIRASEGERYRYPLILRVLD